MDLEITGAPVDSGTYWTIPVTVTTGAVTKGGRAQLGFVSPSVTGLPAGGTDGQVLTKTSGTDYAAAWEDATGGVGTSTPIVPLAYADWPPAAPVADTLYLRLAP